MQIHIILLIVLVILPIQTAGLLHLLLGLSKLEIKESTSLLFTLNWKIHKRKKILLSKRINQRQNKKVC
jgi:hypothetical protein